MNIKRQSSFLPPIVGFSIHRGEDSNADYSPFGVLPIAIGMDGGTVSLDNYRYGFQNQEEDSETGLVNYKYRMHDPRVGRFFAVDPLTSKYPWNSVYAFSENRLLDGVELEGLEYYATGSDPKYAVAEGFRRLFQAFGRLFSASASDEMTHNCKPTISVGNTTVNTYYGYSLMISTNFEEFFANKETDLSKIWDLEARLYLGERVKIDFGMVSYEKKKEIDTDLVITDKEEVKGTFFINGIKVNSEYFKIVNSKGEEVKGTKLSKSLFGFGKLFKANLFLEFDKEKAKNVFSAGCNIENEINLPSGGSVEHKFEFKTSINF